ncbi:MAG: hypothetical protein OZSIB_0542 [Candidatus Ozemobacter sibiricus]|uniref:Uncharacterized protein n=1 Tax=Candidatus Ozemobacter sibiricus TaxID=2268124 RepID=A0A367ZNQ9_9BACT|nr:MAG: hypothetical protein OZSIB_0542 [Candidatus Ozemobacter sibiricus]
MSGTTIDQGCSKASRLCHQQWGRCGVRGGGFSLLEVLIAFLILVGAVIGIIQISRQGGYATESFSAEHFTAMFVAQKVLEDINHRVDQNPHYFTDLIHLAAGTKLGVVDGEHPLFSLLENTRNFSELDPAEDDPIRVESGSIYRQLKNFKVQVGSAFVVGAGGVPAKNLIEVTVTVSWKEGTKGEQVYQIAQRLAGVNEDLFRDPAQPPPPPFSKAQIAYELWYTVPPEFRTANATFRGFLEVNGGDPEVVRAIGQCFAAVESYAATTATDGSDIAALEAAKNRVGDPPRARLQAQEELAELYEVKATAGFQALSRVAPFVTDLKNRTITANQVGRFLGKFRTPILYAMLRGMSMPGRILMLSKAAETEFRGLLDAANLKFLPARKQTPIARRIIDQMKFRILLGDDPDRTLADLKRTIQSYQAMFKGRNPAFMDYLARESQIAQSVSSLKQFYGLGNGLAGQAEKVAALVGDFPQAAARIYPATTDDEELQTAAAAAPPPDTGATVRDNTWVTSANRSHANLGTTNPTTETGASPDPTTTPSAPTSDPASPPPTEPSTGAVPPVEPPPTTAEPSSTATPGDSSTVADPAPPDSSPSAPAAP